MWLLIDSYTGKSRMIHDIYEAEEWMKGCKKRNTARCVWMGEEHILVQL